MDNKQKVLEGLINTKGVFYRKLRKRVNLSIEEFENTLEELTNDNKIYYDRKKEMINQLFEGKIVINSNGNAFIFSEEFENKFYVHAKHIGKSYSTDIVYFYKEDFKLSKTSNDLLESAIVYKVKERSNEYVIGPLKIKKNGKKQVRSFDKNFNVTAEINNVNVNDAVEGSICKVKISSYMSQGLVKGDIIDVVGHKDDPGIDIKQIAVSYGFELKFSEEVTDQLRFIPEKINISDYPNRKDFTDKMLFTIDGDDSKDFDDAVSLDILDNGNYLLGVYIADVNEYVTQDSPLDKEALKRGTSVYLASTVIPMLPHKLSNGICSLNEGVDRLVLACLMQIDPKGNLVDYEICEGIIKSKHRLTYNNVNKIFNDDKETISKYEDIHETLKNMLTLSDIIRNRRVKRGGIEFETLEYKISLDEEFNVKGVDIRERGRAEMLIEDFMLSANETVAYHLNVMQVPCAYRVHENPDYDRVTNVLNMINNLGFNVKIPKNKIHATNVQEAMNKVADSSEAFIVNQLMLRSMMKAKYDSKNLGHFGLAMQYYCHFTSPIRRYPDLIVHRIIKECLVKTKDLPKKVNYFNSVIDDICDRSSKQERKAIDCERETNDMLVADYMSNFIEQPFTGVITSMQGFGMFITLKNGIEGLIHVKEMNGYFEYDEINMKFTDGNTVYNLGQEINVVCTKASKEEKKVGFMLEKDYDLIRRNYENSNSK